MKHLKIFLLLLAAFGTSSLYAKLQGQARLDSLLKELPRQKADTNKAKMLIGISYQYADIDPDSGIKYGLQALEIARSVVWKDGIGATNGALAWNYRTKADYKKAMDCEIEALNYYKEVGDKRKMAILYMDIGTIYRLQADCKRAIEYFSETLKYGEASGDNLFIANALLSIGNANGDDHKTTLDYYFRALKAAEKTGDKSLIGKVTGNIGRVYKQMGDYDMALEYYFKSLAIAEEFSDKNQVAMLTGNIGNVYTKQKNYLVALDYMYKALKMNEALSNKLAISRNYSSIGYCYFHMATDTAAKVRNTLSTVEGSTIKYKPSVEIPEGKSALLQCAVAASLHAIEIANEINAPNVAEDSYMCLENVYKINGDFKKALDASTNWHAIHDSLYSKENKEAILKMTMSNEYESQRLADSLKTAQKEKISTLELSKQKSYTYLGIAGILLLAGFSFFIVKERGKSEKERKKSDGLLLNILPTEVAEELKATGTTTAKHYNNVTVLFTDFVNFTQAAEEMNAQGLIDELHACFKMFDEITSRHNIEKIKTIGDAYLAVCGLPTADAKHAENVVRAATEINAFMQDRLAKMGSERTFAIRIGIHSGSVVAGIVGVKKFAYDIWGDTVNTAARMEQHGEAGKINISETTYNLVKDKFSCAYRGEVEAKGKGVMRMYFVG